MDSLAGVPACAEADCRSFVADGRCQVKDRQRKIASTPGNASTALREDYRVKEWRNQILRLYLLLSISLTQ